MVMTKLLLLVKSIKLNKKSVSAAASTSLWVQGMTTLKDSAEQLLMVERVLTLLT
jgi:hypothetical protein